MENIGKKGEIVDFMNKELTQEEWNSLAVIHRMTNRLNMGVRFDYSKSIDVKTINGSQIVDDSVFLDKEKTKPIINDEYKNKIINELTGKYGDSYIAKEKANSFGVGFNKAWDMLTKHLK